MIQMVILMNNYQQLFIDLKIKLTNEIYEKYSKQMNEIARTQKKSVFTILDEIAKIILEYNVKDEVMTRAVRVKKAITEKLQKCKKILCNYINNRTELTLSL